MNNLLLAQQMRLEKAFFVLIISKKKKNPRIN